MLVSSRIYLAGVSAITLACILVRINFFKKKTLPKSASAGFVENIRQLTSNRAPWYILELARKLGPLFKVLGSDFPYPI